jgi:hypothetical protein
MGADQPAGFRLAEGDAPQTLTDIQRAARFYYLSRTASAVWSTAAHSVRRAFAWPDYDYADAATLLADFWKEVDIVVQERSSGP